MEYVFIQKTENVLYLHRFWKFVNTDPAHFNFSICLLIQFLKISLIDTNFRIKKRMNSFSFLINKVSRNYRHLIFPSVRLSHANVALSIVTFKNTSLS